MPSSEITIAELLKGQGYHTAHIGKWHLGRQEGMTPETQGFDESLLMDIGLYLPKDDPNVVNSKQDFDTIDRFLWSALQFAVSFSGGERFEPGEVPDRLLHRRSRQGHRSEQGIVHSSCISHIGLRIRRFRRRRKTTKPLSHIELHRERVYAAMNPGPRSRGRPGVGCAAGQRPRRRTPS